MKVPYTFTVLRYVHDTATGEFVNVGVALYAPGAKFAGARCRTTYGRLTKTFPGLDGEAFKSLMRRINNRFDEIAAEVANELPLKGLPATIMEMAWSVLPPDDSSLQWSPAGGGVTEDLPITLTQIYDRMVERYEDGVIRARRSDEDVWTRFRRDLETRNIAVHLQSKKITVPDDEVEFEHAYKNGVWHCLKPISFDLSADGITEKAHRWLGQLTSVKSASDPFKVYLLVGEPQQRDLKATLDKALSILQKIPVEKEIILERDAAAFSERFAKNVVSQAVKIE
jgi:hypothetical protein